MMINYRHHTKIDETVLPGSTPTAEQVAMLKALGDFTRRTGIIIHGCGCCGSPSAEVCRRENGAVGYGAEQVSAYSITASLENIGWSFDLQEYTGTLTVAEGDHTVMIREDGTAWVDELTLENITKPSV